MLAGLPPRIVAEQIKHSRSSFDTSPEALKKLHSEGVPEIVILATFHAKKGDAPEKNTSVSLGFVQTLHSAGMHSLILDAAEGTALVFLYFSN